MPFPLLDQITAATQCLADRLMIVASENLPITCAAGRVLSEAVRADRDSPAADVSAMDGFAIRVSDLGEQPLKISGISAAGQPPVSLQGKTALRIFTGGVVPCEADAVIKREDCVELDGYLTVKQMGDSVSSGQHIRRRGENGRVGNVILPAGTLLTASKMATLATFGPSELSVRRRIRVAILNTGDELVAPGAPAQAWQVRDSNGPFLDALVGERSRLANVRRAACVDELSALVQLLGELLDEADAVLLTGGVSMGDRDLVPDAIRQCGGETIFHRLPIRPGRPVLGAVTSSGKLIIGLPGNPVSVAVTARQFAIPLLQHVAGMSLAEPPRRSLFLENADSRTLDLIWYRLVKITGADQAVLVESRGSGDLVSLSASDGYVEVPAGMFGPGPWLFTAW